MNAASSGVKQTNSGSRVSDCGRVHLTECVPLGAKGADKGPHPEGTSNIRYGRDLEHVQILTLSSANSLKMHLEQRMEWNQWKV